VTLSRRLTLLFAATAVLVSGAIGGLSYAATDQSLDTTIRVDLEEAAVTLTAGGTPSGLAPADDTDTLKPKAGDGDSGDGGNADADGKQLPPRPDLLLAQTLSAAGTVASIDGRDTPLPVNDADQALARSAAEHVEQFRVVTVDGARYLMVTRAQGHAGGAVQVAHNLSDRDRVLTRLAGSILAMVLAVAAAAALAGWFVARRITRGLVRLTAVAEQVSETGRLDITVPAGGTDEVGRLGAAFDTMLDRLARSKDDQQRLVQDAGHELRTPLTSIRTNLSLLRQFDRLALDERAEILDDLASESRELTDLVNELVQLATDRRTQEADEDVDLVVIAERVAERAIRRHGRPVVVRTGDADGDLTARELILHGRPAALERALTNLVDNAIKFDQGGSEPIEIMLAPGRLEVRDRGPGIPDDELPRIFDRFHRATAVRSLPGSGLGLSIVQDVAAGHDGQVFARNRDGGGAVIGFTLGDRRFQPGSYPR
jgi:two-component system sensor histidine kinase MprB